jgi:hypothetical protein
MAARCCGDKMVLKIVLVSKATSKSPCNLGMPLDPLNNN